jgi:hypothetical protein
MIDLKADAYEPTTGAGSKPSSIRGGSSRLLRGGVMASLFALVVLFICVGSAFADSASISVTNTAGQSDPAADLPRVFTVSGDTAAPEHIFIKYRSPGGAPCASTANTDTGTWFENYNDAYFNDAPEANGAFSYSHAGSWNESGTFVFCIWVAESGDTIVATPITQTITFRSPTGTITATVNPITPEPGQKATITITGSSEAAEEVFAKIQPAGGSGCAPTYEADSGSNLVEGEKVNGSFSEQATTTESKAGQYLICLWLAESSNDTSPVAGPQPETFTVASPPPPPPPPPPAPSAECLRDRGGVAHEEVLIRRYEVKLRAHHLPRRTKRKDERALTAARKSASKYEGLRLHQCPGGK